MARRNDKQQGPVPHSRNRALAHNLYILFSELILPAICVAVICVGLVQLSSVRISRDTATVPADAEIGNGSSVTGEGSIAYPAPENGAHQQMLATAALRNSPGVPVEENSGRQSFYKHR